jgi:hypothetical protein
VNQTLGLGAVIHAATSFFSERFLACRGRAWLVRWVDNVPGTPLLIFA